jgi:membrane protein DedA with SNARE-associated domain
MAWTETGAVKSKFTLKQFILFSILSVASWIILWEIVGYAETIVWELLGEYPIIYSSLIMMAIFLVLFFIVMYVAWRLIQKHQKNLVEEEDLYF